MTESTSNVIHAANGSSAQEYSETNVANEMLLNINEPTSDTNQNIELSDDESTITIGEISADEYFDDIYDEKVVYEDIADLNVENGPSSNGINVVNNDHNEEIVNGRLLISRDVLLAQPIVVYERHTHTHEHIQGHSHGHTHSPRFGYRQGYTPRAAAVKAAAQISKSGTNRNGSKNKTQHIKKKNIRSLRHLGIKTPTILKNSCLLDLHVMKTNRYILKLPAALNVYQILNNYQRKTNMCPEVTDILITTFDQALSTWCLHFIERLQYDELIRRFPNRQASELYGLAHLIRFIGFLPRLFNKLGSHYTLFNEEVALFMNGFMDYLVEENLHVDFHKDYDHILPEYLRMTQWSLRNIQQRRSH